jgi:hypothetical protein
MGEPASLQKTIVLLSFIDLRNAKQIQDVASALNAHYPDCEVISLNTPTTKEIEVKVSAIHRWITIQGKVTAVLKQLKQLRHSRPYITCILYQMPKPHAHLMLEMLAAAIGGRQYLNVLGPDCIELRPLKRSSLWFRIINKGILTLLHSIISAILAIIVAIFLVVLSKFSKPSDRYNKIQTGKIKK